MSFAVTDLLERGNKNPMTERRECGCLNIFDSLFSLYEILIFRWWDRPSSSPREI